MIRYLLLILNMLGLLLFRLFFSGEVTVSQNMPANMNPGGEYVVELTINKGSIGGFAKLQQEFPHGVTVTMVDGKGASFSFNGNILKLIWTSLPSENEFKISYKLTLDPTIQPITQPLAGKFFYVLDNTKQSIDIKESNLVVGGGGSGLPAAPIAKKIEPTPVQAAQPSQQAQVTPPTPSTAQSTVQPPVQPAPLAQSSPQTAAVTPGTPEAPVINTATSTPVNVPLAPAPTQNQVNPTPPTSIASTAPAVPGLPLGTVSCERKITAISPTEYHIELTVNKGSINGFAKIQENIPAGLAAAGMQLLGSSFNFGDQKVKMVWIKLPSEPTFKVTYKLTGTPQGNSIEGLLSYLENDATKKLVITSSPIPIPSQNQPIALAPSEPAPANTGVSGASGGSSTVTPVGLGATGSTGVVSGVGVGAAGAAAAAGTASAAGPNGVVSTAGTNGITSAERATGTTSATRSTGTAIAAGPNGGGNNTVPNAGATITGPTPKGAAGGAKVKGSIPATPLVAKKSESNSTGVNYKVQICALRKQPISSNYFTNKFGVNNINTELHEGWTKYTSGNYKEYKDARDFREIIRSKGLPQSFIAAYNGGKRITVQEALMVTNQQWYK